MNFLSTDKYTAEEIGRLFYNIACSYNIRVAGDETVLTVFGLQENFEKAVSLVEDVLTNCKADEKALNDYKSRIFKTRNNNKLNKGVILSGLASYAQFGPDNPFNYDLKKEQIDTLSAKYLVDILHNLFKYKHVATYFGPKDQQSFISEVEKIHALPNEFRPTPEKKKFSYVKTAENKVFFADYDMVQAEIIWSRNDGPFNPLYSGKINLFNNYFGDGMSSIVFQTIRESKALAYSCYAYYVSPRNLEQQYNMQAYVGAQADKMNDAVTGMNELLNKLPESDKAFTTAKESALSGIQNERITDNDIIETYLSDKKLGIDHDAREDVYNQLKPLTFNDVKQFHAEQLANKPFNYCIVASEKKISPDALKKYGTFTKLSLEQIFGY